MLGSVIASMHNLGFILQLVDGARVAITEGRFAEYKATFVREYYALRRVLPDEVILPVEIDAMQGVAEMLADAAV